MAGNDTSVPSTMLFKFDVKKREVPKRYSNYELTFGQRHYESLVVTGPTLCHYMYIGYDTVNEVGLALVNFTSSISEMAVLTRFAGLCSSATPILGGYKGFLRHEKHIMDTYAGSNTCLVNCFGQHAAPGTRNDLSEENAPVYHAIRRLARERKLAEKKRLELSRSKAERVRRRRK